MSVGDALRKNLEFWHWYPKLLCEGLTEEQLHWQPENHPNHIAFTLWHAYRSEDEIVHRLLIDRPSVLASEGWAQRLPVADPGTHLGAPGGSAVHQGFVGTTGAPL